MSAKMATSTKRTTTAGTPAQRAAGAMRRMCPQTILPTHRAIRPVPPAPSDPRPCRRSSPSHAPQSFPPSLPSPRHSLLSPSHVPLSQPPSLRSPRHALPSPAHVPHSQPPARQHLPHVLPSLRHNRRDGPARAALTAAATKTASPRHRNSTGMLTRVPAPAPPRVRHPVVHARAAARHVHAVTASDFHSPPPAT